MALLTAEISVVLNGKAQHVEPVGAQALFVGRGSDNDLVLADAKVSKRHAVLYFSDLPSNLLLRDLGSTNGTYVNDEPARGVVKLGDGDRISLGRAIDLRVSLQRQEAGPLLRPPPSLLADLTCGIAHPIRKERILVGHGEGCDIRFPDATEAACCISLREDGEIDIASPAGDRSVSIGEPFGLAGHEFVFRHSRATLADTVRDALEPPSYSYQITVSLESESGTAAAILDPSTGKRHVVRAENRVSLLFVLARKVIEHQQEGKGSKECGWCRDSAVMTGVWGRHWENMGLNNYQVLICRTRKEIENAGLDPWFLEKRRGYTRIRLQDVWLGTSGDFGCQEHDTQPGAQRSPGEDQQDEADARLLVKPRLPSGLAKEDVEMLLKDGVSRFCR